MLEGSWTLFADAVSSLSLIDLPNAGFLRNCLLCTSADGTIGIISLADMEQ